MSCGGRENCGWTVRWNLKKNKVSHWSVHCMEEKEQRAALESAQWGWTDKAKRDDFNVWMKVDEWQIDPANYAAQAFVVSKSVPFLNCLRGFPPGAECLGFCDGDMYLVSPQLRAVFFQVTPVAFHFITGIISWQLRIPWCTVCFSRFCTSTWLCRFNLRWHICFLFCARVWYCQTSQLLQAWLLN